MDSLDTVTISQQEYYRMQQEIADLTTELDWVHDAFTEKANYCVALEIEIEEIRESRGEVIGQLLDRVNYSEELERSITALRTELTETNDELAKSYAFGTQLQDQLDAASDEWLELTAELKISQASGVELVDLIEKIEQLEAEVEKYKEDEREGERIYEAYEKRMADRERLLGPVAKKLHYDDPDFIPLPETPSPFKDLIIDETPSMPSPPSPSLCRYTPPSKIEEDEVEMDATSPNLIAWIPAWKIEKQEEVMVSASPNF